MLRRLIANSLIALLCLSVFAPVAFALQSTPMMACCRRAGHHRCKCCSGRKLGSNGPEFLDTSLRCPCSSQMPTRTVQGDLPQHVVLTAGSPLADILCGANWSLCRSTDRIEQFERGPPARRG